VSYEEEDTYEEENTYLGAQSRREHNDRHSAKKTKNKKTSGHSLDASTMTGIVQIQPTMDKIADSPRQNTLSGRHHVSKETYK
jgi:hypothetical protein